MLFMKKRASQPDENNDTGATVKMDAANDQNGNWRMFSDRREIRKRREITTIRQNRAPRGIRTCRRSRSEERRKSRCFSKDWYLRTSYLE